MKQRLFLLQIALILFLLISSCSSDIPDAAGIAESAQKLLSAKYLAHITANFPEREASFSLEYIYNRDGDDRATVVAPEEIAGISLRIIGEAAELDFDGARLEMGKLGSGDSPLSAIPSLISSWTDGNFAEVQKSKIFGREAILVISRYSDEDSVSEYRTWFSKDEHIPLYAEIFSDGERIIQCEFERAEHIT